MHLVLLDDEVFRQLCAKHLQSAHLLCNYSGLAPKLQALPDWSSGVENMPAVPLSADPATDVCKARLLRVAFFDVIEKA